jgi:hypothetical protein
MLLQASIYELDLIHPSIDCRILLQRNLKKSISFEWMAEILVTADNVDAM